MHTQHTNLCFTNIATWNMMLLRFNDFIASISRSSAYDKNCMHRMCASLHLYLRVWQHRCGTRIFYLNWRDVNNAFVYICRLHQKHYQRIRLNNCVLCDVNVKVRYDCDLCGMLYFLKKCRKNSERCVRSRASSRQIDIFFALRQLHRQIARKKEKNRRQKVMFCMQTLPRLLSVIQTKNICIQIWSRRWMEINEFP